MAVVLQAENLSKIYSIDDRSIAVVDTVSLSIERGEFLVIKGASGSGKSTLLNLLSGLDTPSSGSVLINAVDISQYSEDELASMRNTLIGFIFQSFYLMPAMSAMDNVLFPAQLKGLADAKQRAINLLETVGLGQRMNNYPQQLSGGEQQRVAIARALINDPEIIFADEPTGNLDSHNSDSVLALLLDLHKQRQTTLIMVTHDASIADRADRVIQLVDGKIL